MPLLIAIEAHEAQRRKLEETISDLAKKGYDLVGKVEAASFKSASDSAWTDVLSASRSGGLFSEKTLSVVEGAEALGPFPIALLDCLEDDGADNVVVAVFSGDTKKIFTKESVGKIKFIKADTEIKPWERRDWLLRMANERGAKMDSDAAALLCDFMTSTEELRSELDKLSLAADNAPITVDTVRRLSFDEGGNSMLRFLDGVCEGRVADVVTSLRHLEGEPVLPLLTALYNRLRPALYIALTSPKTEAQFLAAIGATREYALRMARTALRNFGADNIKLFMLRLIRLSYIEKTGLSEGWPGFEAALWGLMGNSERTK
ncbi:DNA polymerase III subunit delta [Synergistales bacterium]|nr:DNA polymerase III subunit delta [Synergistales bacterium]